MVKLISLLKTKNEPKNGIKQVLDGKNHLLSNFFSLIYSELQKKIIFFGLE